MLAADAENLKLNTLRDSFSTIAELLSSDEKSRKKHAAAIKAFEIGNVWINAYAEISGIWKESNLSTLNRLIPGWGPTFAAIQTAFAVGRATAATRKIAAQQFAGGGFTGSGINLKDDTGFNIAGIVHEGEYVIPKRIVENPQFAPTISMLEMSRQNGFAQGGFVQTPSFSYNTTAPTEMSLEKY